MADWSSLRPCLSPPSSASRRPYSRSSSTTNTSSRPQAVTMATGGAQASKSGRQIALHPLAIVTMCDHSTRVKVGGTRQAPNSRILGLLFGTQDGLEAVITDAIELQYEMVNGEVRIDSKYIDDKKELYTAVYPTHDLMGWYSVGEEVATSDLQIHRAMMAWNESPLFLLLNPVAESGKDLPLILYESELHIVNDSPTIIFVNVPFRLETAQAERISVEHVVKATPTDGVSPVDLHVAAVTTSLKALTSRIRVLLHFLQSTKEGKVEPDYRLLRQISMICNDLPASTSDSFFRSLQGDYNDTLVITLLASVTKVLSMSNEVADKAVMAYNDRSRRRGV